jgi:gamma-glutamylcyclotransferase (GGCT)/AIG2-like uncharacterized protein YtfP
VTLHFAYGSNMSRAVMRKHAPGAQPVGVARLAGYRFVITADGYASVAPARAQTVHGVLWRLTQRDVVTLDAWESVAGGLYRAETLPVRVSGRCALALVYIARPCGEGRPKPGYIELVIAAAREWDLPAAYVQSLARWSPARRSGARTAKLGEFG